MWAVPVLIALNVLAFLVCIAAGMPISEPTALELFTLGGSSLGAVLMRDEYWRLATAALLHNGYVHLGMNLAGMMIIGGLVQSLYGPYRTLLAYVVAAIVGSAASMWAHPLSVGVGASGAVFGLYGAVLPALFTDRFAPEVRRSLLKSYGAFAVVNVLTGLLPQVDLAAHIAGVIAGTVTGAVFLADDPPLSRRLPRMWTVAGLVVAMAASSATLLAIADRATTSRIESPAAYTSWLDWLGRQERRMDSYSERGDHEMASRICDAMIEHIVFETNKATLPFDEMDKLSRYARYLMARSVLLSYNAQPFTMPDMSEQDVADSLKRQLDAAAAARPADLLP
jgi:rhomboid protease GluP